MPGYWPRAISLSSSHLRRLHDWCAERLWWQKSSELEYQKYCNNEYCFNLNIIDGHQLKCIYIWGWPSILCIVIIILKLFFRVFQNFTWSGNRSAYSHVTRVDILKNKSWILEKIFHIDGKNRILYPLQIFKLQRRSKFQRLSSMRLAHVPNLLLS